MKPAILLIICCSWFMSKVVAQSNPSDSARIELKDLLKEFYDFSSLPAYSSGNFSAEVSTYDRTGMNDDGFGGKYSFVRRNPDSSLVIFDEKGPGVINRIWTPTPTDDTLDFYIDDSLRPSFSISYRDLFSEKVPPFTAPLCANQLGGYYAYLPIPFNVSCKIILKAKITRFHQVGFRLYPKETKVKSFSLPLSTEETQELEKIKMLWARDNITVKDIYGPQSSFDENKKLITIHPGQSVVIFQSATPGRIAGFELISSASLDSIAKNIDIKITWDDEKIAAVYCPLADFFGYAFGTPSMKGLLAGSDGKKHYSWFPMPYDKSAKVALIYRNTSGDNALNSVTLQSKFYVQPKKRDIKNEGKFYASWNRENPVTAGKVYTMLAVKGKGHFAGVALQSQGLVPGITGFFEGDDSTVIDGEMRLHGTGSEDFFNGGWYALLDRWDDATSLPMSGALDYSIPLCRTGGYRYFITDKLSFNKSFYQSIEHGPEHNLWPADYTSVSYHYCDRANPQRLFPNNANTKIYKPDTLELYPQLLFTAMDENVAAEAKWEGSPAKTMYYTITSESLLKMYLQDIPPGQYDVYMDYQKSADAAQFSVWQRQTQLSEWIDAYAVSKEKLSMQKVAAVRVTDLNRSLSFRFKTTGQKNKFSLTRIIFVRK